MKRNKETALSDLPLGSLARITKMPENNELRFALMRLGIAENTIICRAFKGPFGDPDAYFFRGTLVSVRNKDAQTIQVIPYGGTV